jgi:hypothetical protein
MEKFADIIEQIKKQKTMNPPESLTDNVTGRLPHKYPGILSIAAFVYHLYMQVYMHVFETDGSQEDGITCRECSFYFFITGLFYLIMGIVLMMGLQGMDSGTAMMKWIKLQPYFTMGTAIWLLALGAILMMDESIGIKIAKYGTLLYIFCAVANSILLWPHLRIPYAGIFITGLAATGALMGIMLVRAVHKMELRTI